MELEALVGTQVVMVATESGQVLEGRRPSVSEGDPPMVDLEAVGHIAAGHHAVAVPLGQCGLEG